LLTGKVGLSISSEPIQSMSIILKLRSYEGFFTDILSANTEGTKKQYHSALLDFEKYCQKEFSMSLEAMIIELKAVKLQDQILLLQRWINASKSHPRTKRSRAGCLNKYLFYREINIDQRDFKQIKYGKMSKSYHKPLTKEILKQIFNRSSMKRKTLYLFLVSSGCRINEAVKLHKKDFDLSGKRIKVEIYQSKNDETRLAYLTTECARMIKPLLNRINDNDLVFGVNQDPDKSVVTEQQCFRRVTDLLGLGKERRRSGLRHITIHSLRGYCFTQFTKTHNADLAHAYIGREQYLDTYLSMPESEQLDYFVKVEPMLFINEEMPEADTVLNLRTQLETAQSKASLVDDLMIRLQKMEEKQDAYMEAISKGLISIKESDDPKVKYTIDKSELFKVYKTAQKENKQ